MSCKNVEAFNSTLLNRGELSFFEHLVQYPNNILWVLRKIGWLFEPVYHLFQDVAHSFLGHAFGCISSVEAPGTIIE